MISCFAGVGLFVLIGSLRSVLPFTVLQVSSKNLSGIKSQKITSLWLAGVPFPQL